MRARTAIGLWLAALAAGCAQGWNAEEWARAQPELAGRSIGRLAESTPYLLATEDTLVLFLCRWSLDGPLRVSLPPETRPDERDLFERALRAWEGAVPGLRFEIVEGSAPLRVRFRDTGPEGARTATDCEVEPPTSETGPLRARVVSAQIDLRRAERDPWGRPIELSATDLLASATHELGHALGLQGHARGGKSAMVKETAALRRVGERIQEGKPLEEPAMAALYAVPSGSVVERRRLEPGATAAVDAIARRAIAAGARTVTVRVGDRGAAVRWGPGQDLVYYIRSPEEIAEEDLDFSDAVQFPGD